jgi:hypothetical protein
VAGEVDAGEGVERDEFVDGERVGGEEVDQAGDREAKHRVALDDAAEYAG